VNNLGEPGMLASTAKDLLAVASVLAMRAAEYQFKDKRVRDLRVKNRQSVAEAHEEIPGVMRTWEVDSRIVGW
jgi:hypothetical protein